MLCWGGATTSPRRYTGRFRSTGELGTRTAPVAAAVRHGWVAARARSGLITLVITITGPITGFGLVITIRLPRWYGNQDPDYLESGNQMVIRVIVITEDASPGGLISFN